MKLPFLSGGGPSRDPEPVEHAHAPGSGSPEELTRLAGELETLSRRAQAHALSIDQLGSQLGDLRERMDRLTIAVAEGIEHVDRAERRVRATVARARRELEENGMVSPGVEAEYSELRERHGDGSGEGRVPSVRPEVESSPQAPPGVPGYFSSDHIRALRGG